MSKIRFKVQDFSGQRRIEAAAPARAGMKTAFERITREMKLPRVDSTGTAIVYKAINNTDGGRHLRLVDDKSIGEEINPSDDITMVPNIEAGSRNS